MPRVLIKRDGANAEIPLPAYATAGAAGMDIRSSQTAALEPGRFAAIGTGLYLEIPEGYEGQVRPRSGLALKHGVTVLNTPGTIDSDYRGELRVILINHGSETFPIEPGDRIAQIIFAPVTQMEIAETGKLGESERAVNGFGSTGIK